MLGDGVGSGGIFGNFKFYDIVYTLYVDLGESAKAHGKTMAIPDGLERDCGSGVVRMGSWSFMALCTFFVDNTIRFWLKECCWICPDLEYIPSHSHSVETHLEKTEKRQSIYHKCSAGGN